MPAVPRSILPLAVERQYVRLLYGWVVQWQHGVMAAALHWYERHPAREAFRTDSTAAMPFPVETLRTTPSDIRAIGERVAAHNAATYERVVGIPIHDVLAPQRIAEFERRNLDLITSLNESQVNELAPILGQAVAEGWASRVLQQKIAERFGVGQSRAELIARDQVLKLNAQVTRDRHEEAGIESYTWRTSGDERVRDTHAELEGEEFRYDDPPVTNDNGDTNNPGEDYQCRCTADPVLPTYDEETEEGDDESAAEEEQAPEEEASELAAEPDAVQEFTEIEHPGLGDLAILPDVPEIAAEPIEKSPLEIVTDIRERYQPEAFAAEFRAQYAEAAPSVGWGKAMQERGLDFPIDHGVSIASRYEDPAHPHPLLKMGKFLRDRQAEGISNLRQLVGTEHEIAAQGASAILGHLDGILAHSAEDLEIRSVGGTPADLARLQRATGWLSEMTDAGVKLPIIDYKVEPMARASCNSQLFKGTSYIKVSEKESYSTIHHELGHALEASDKTRGVRASAFLDARTVGERLESLRDITGNHGYGADELSRRDAFRDPYIGMDYGRGKGEQGTGGSGDFYGEKSRVKNLAHTRYIHEATEVTSMAIQELHNWRTVMTVDPEHFLFGLGQLGAL